MISIGSVKDIDMELYDEVWYITNTNPRMVVGAQHHPELAPDKETFFKYLRHEVTLKQLRDVYREELRGCKRQCLENLVKKSQSGLWILCVCYCEKYTICHRQVLYEELSSEYNDVVLVS